MFYLRRFIELCNSGLVESADKSAEGAAHTTYASCLQQVSARLLFQSHKCFRPLSVSINGLYTHLPSSQIE